MKRKVFLLALILIIGLGAIASFGAGIKETNIIPDKYSRGYKDRESWIKEMFNLRRERLKEALERGLITEEEARKWEEHFNYMEKFHEENDHGPFGCGGFGFGRRRGRSFMGRPAYR